jgi:hypothetical protein
MTMSASSQAMTPADFQEPRWARYLFASTTAAWLWLVVRLYMASVFIPAGWGKITSGAWLFGDGAPIQGMVGGAVASEDTPGWIILGTLLVVAWRNAGWIGLDRWFIPWTHRTMFSGRAPGEAVEPTAAPPETS